MDSRSGVEAKGEDREKDNEEGREAASATIEAPREAALTCTCTCTCRGIPIVPSRRMLETLLLDEDSLLLTWSISTVFRVFNAVLCIFMGCCSSDFFLCIRLFPLVFQQSFELLDIFCLSGFSGQLVPWLCHSHTETVSSHLCPCILVDQV